MLKKILIAICRKCRHQFAFVFHTKNNPIKWGILGLGYMAETFSTAIDGNKNGVVYSVASRSIEKADKFKKRHHAKKSYGSYEDFLNDEDNVVDVVYIATPVKYHYTHIKMCLESGKNVLCEKPITSSLEEFNELLKIAQKYNCFFMEGMWMKCLPSFQKACKWISDGRIGTLDLVRVDFYKREHVRTDLAIYDKYEYGGVLRDFGVYAIAFMEHFLGGYPEELYANSCKSSFGIDSNWQITANRGGVQAFVNLSSNFGSMSKAVVIGQKGFIEWDSQFNRTNTIKLYDSNGIQIDRFKINYDYDGFEYEVNEVQNCIREGRRESKIVPLLSTFNVQRIIDAIS